MRDLVGERFVDEIPLASGSFMAMRTAHFRRIGGFDARYFLYFEDYDLSLRLGRDAAISYDPAVRIVHHGGYAAAKGLRHVAWFLRSATRFFSTHGWRLR
jgi:GT2 family glycosyltransferase